MKIAICQVADTGPLESLVVMLNAAGYSVLLPNQSLKRHLVDLGCTNVLDQETLVLSGSYCPALPLSHAGIEEMNRADLYVDTKAHVNGAKVRRRWPNLANKILWYRINGDKPVITEQGDEINPGCPILTPNQWYKDDPTDYVGYAVKAGGVFGRENWGSMAYVCWPPFYRFKEHGPRRAPPHTPPICLINGFSGWGYEPCAREMREILQVAIHGIGAPDGLFPHNLVKERLRTALAYVHLKSSDAPGYALYEALASGCPCIVSRRLIARQRFYKLFVPGETCAVFDAESGPLDSAQCIGEVRQALIELSRPALNVRIGSAGRDRLKEIMWDADVNTGSFRRFMEERFP